MNLIFLFTMMLILVGLIVFASSREHLLSMLLSLEFISLGIYFMMLINLGYGDLFYSLIYITFSACEGALGLSILVMMSRTHGGDYFKSFNMVN